MALMTKVGYGQVEPNLISGINAGKVFADIPVQVAALENLENRVENGQFLAVNYGEGIEGVLRTGELVVPDADSTVIGLVYSEVKLYSQFTSNKDFALFVDAPSIMQMGTSPYYDKKEVPHATIVPRLIGLTLGDIFTTNLIEGDYDTISAGDTLKLNADGILSTSGTLDLIEAKVAQKTTMADGQPALKVAITKV